MAGVRVSLIKGWAVHEIKYYNIFLATFFLPIIALLIFYVGEYTESSLFVVSICVMFLEIWLVNIVLRASEKNPFIITDDEHITYLIIIIGGITAFILNGFLQYPTKNANEFAGLLFGIFTIGMGLLFFGGSILLKLIHSTDK